jgi:tetratricopeptide (TPR) repeat protein
VVTAAPDDAEAQRELADAAARLRDYPLAIRAFERHLALTRPGPADHVRHADLLLMAHRPEATAAAIERARAATGDGPDLKLLEARCARLAGDYAACRDAAEAVLVVRPADGDAWQLRLENADEAELPGLLERCEPLLHRTETDPGARNRMLIALAAGRGRERLGEPDAAFGLCRQGKEIQRGQLEARGAAYDPVRQAESFGRIIRSFPGRAATAPSAGIERSPVFIVGMPRSGTTLVERILGSIDGVDTAGENEALEFVAHEYQRDRHLGRRPEPAEMTPADWQRLADAYWQRTGGEPRRITDKMPHNFRHLGLIDALFPDAPVLWLRRDPRDVGLSLYVRPFPDGHPYACDLAALGHFHAQSERLLRHWQAAWPGRILEVDYAALVADPETATRRITEHCALEWTPDCLRFHERTEASFTFSELQVRRPINADGIGRWHRHAQALAPLIEALREGGVELPSGS